MKRMRMKGWLRPAGTMAPVAALVLLAASVVLSPAATLTVTSLAGSGPGSLRERIAAAADGDQIHFAVIGTINLGGAQLVVNKGLTIVGPGATLIDISGQDLSPVLHVVSGIKVNISGLTFRNGATNGPDGIRVNLFDPDLSRPGSPGISAGGGGILNHGTLSLTRCILRNNVASGGDGGFDPGAKYASGDGHGGGIANHGVLRVEDCLFDGNQALGGEGAGAFAFEARPGGAGLGGAIANHGVLSVHDCTFQNNIGQGGVGGFANANELTPAFENVRGGMGGAGGGGAIWHRDLRPPVVMGSTFHGNSARGGRGGTANADARNIAGLGGVANGGAIESRGPLTATNCTGTANQARGGDTGQVLGVGTSRGLGTSGGPGRGGAIASFGPLTVTACTLATNAAVGGNGDSPGSGGSALGGNLYREEGAASIWSSIIAGGQSTPGTGRFPGAALGPDVQGSIVSLGHNLIGNPDASGPWADSDLLGELGAPLSPLLGPLQANGGLTATMAPLPGSPALDAGDDALSVTLKADQRGAPRRLKAHVDIGAHEVGGYPVINNNDDGPGSLRQAVQLAPAADPIVFGPNVSTIRLTSGPITIDRNLVALGPMDHPVAVSGNYRSRVLQVAVGRTVTLSNLTVRDGLAIGPNGNANLRGTNALGGGVLNLGTLFLVGCTLQENQAIGGDGGDGFPLGGYGGYGLGGAAANLGTMRLTNCTLAANSAVGGDGGDGVLTSPGGNGGDGYGGALYNEGALTLHSCTVSGNTASGGRGGTGFGNGLLGFGLGGGLYQTNGIGSTGVGNSILADNSSVVSRTSTGPDAHGTFLSLRYNLVGMVDGSSGWVTTTGGAVPPDLIGTMAAPLSARLGPLQDNGGPTLTKLLLADSPAIDKGSRVSPTDQRGRAGLRDLPAYPNTLLGGGSDIGAVEIESVALDIGLRLQDRSNLVRIAVEGGGVISSPLRINKNGTTYGILLTAPDAPDASRFRVQTPSGVKALVKLP